MYFNAEVAGLSFLDTLDRGMGSRGEVTDSLRLLSKEDFQMSDFLLFSVLRGSEDSASIKDLGFTVLSAGLENNLLKFEIEFDDPEQVSIGYNKDIIVTTIVDGSFFSSEQNGLPLEPGTTIQ